MTSEPVNGKAGYSSDSGDHSKEHDCDEPGGTICSLGRGLGDAEGVDEGICEIEQRLHGPWMIGAGYAAWANGCIFKV